MTLTSLRYKYYEQSAECYAYLSDVPESDGTVDLDVFAKSNWFTRGWTLQELLAPSHVFFLSSNWTAFGHKCSERQSRLRYALSYACRSRKCGWGGMRLNASISKRTGIDRHILDKRMDLKSLPADQICKWIEQRETKKEEDLAYCLLGLFGVFLVPNYGEGENAWSRLEEEVSKKRKRQQSLPRPSQIRPNEEPYKPAMLPSPILHPLPIVPSINYDFISRSLLEPKPYSFSGTTSTTLDDFGPYPGLALPWSPASEPSDHLYLNQNMDYYNTENLSSPVFHTSDLSDVPMLDSDFIFQPLEDEGSHPSSERRPAKLPRREVSRSKSCNAQLCHREAEDYEYSKQRRREDRASTRRNRETRFRGSLEAGDLPCLHSRHSKDRVVVHQPTTTSNRETTSSTSLWPSVSLPSLTSGDISSSWHHLSCIDKVEGHNNSNLNSDSSDVRPDLSHKNTRATATPSPACCGFEHSSNETTDVQHAGRQSRHKPIITIQTG